MHRYRKRSLLDSGWIAVLAAVVAAAAPLGSCAPATLQPSVPETQIVWPAPPAAPRVAFVQEISTPGDIGVEPSLWERLRRVIAGPSRKGMVRPAAVAISADLLVVVDPGAQGLHLFDRAERSYRFVSGCKGRRLRQPTGAAFLAGRLYVSDSAERAVYVLSGSGDCLGRWPVFTKGRPTGLAADHGRGRLLVADTTGHKLRVFDPDGAPMLEFGARGTKAGEFNFPGWLSAGHEGKIYVVDSLNFRIQVFDPGGEVVGGFGKAGDSPGYFARPKGIGTDSMGNVYVVDALFDAVQIFDESGRLLLNFGERGTGPGQFWLPSGLTIDDRDFIYVADSYNKRVQVFRFLR
jgi:DNA-binding beta-propeller fold protein YncE